MHAEQVSMPTMLTYNGQQQQQQYVCGWVPVFIDQSTVLKCLNKTNDSETLPSSSQQNPPAANGSSYISVSSFLENFNEELEINNIIEQMRSSYLGDIREACDFELDIAFSFALQAMGKVCTSDENRSNLKEKCLKKIMPAVNLCF